MNRILAGLILAIGVCVAASAGPFSISGPPSPLPQYTVATLPACGAGTNGLLLAVTDATAPLYNTALTGGSSTHVPVYCNGTAWSSH